jgi:hypothetical protein
VPPGVRAEQDDRHDRDDEELGGIEVEHRSSLYDSYAVLGALTEVSGVDIGKLARITGDIPGGGRE